MSFVLLSSWYLEDDLFPFLQAGPKLIFKISETIKMGFFSLFPWSSSVMHCTSITVPDILFYKGNIPPTNTHEKEGRKEKYNITTHATEKMKCHQELKALAHPCRTASSSPPAIQSLVDDHSHECTCIAITHVILYISSIRVYVWFSVICFFCSTL